MDIEFHALPSRDVARIRSTARDAYGNKVERQVSTGSGTPCRCCLKTVPKGQEFLILAHRPFRSANPYAETGPIFLCAANCEAAKPEAGLPDMLSADEYIVRGYSADERIVYGSGKVVPTSRIPDYAATLLGAGVVDFVDVRSASNNCYQCRVRARA